METQYEHIELQTILHQHCNLHCKFCFQTKCLGIRKKSYIHIKYIRQLSEYIKKYIFPRLKNPSRLTINMMGGELFSDDIPDSIFEEYQYFIQDLISKTPDFITLIFQSISNGIYSKYERIYQLLDKYKIKLILSYDPLDRFSKEEQKEIWWNTFQYFYERKITISVSTILRKKSIEKYIQGDPIFDRIPGNIFIDTSEYCPRLDYLEDIVSDDMIFSFYVWGFIHRRFNIHQISVILKSKIGIFQEVCSKGNIFRFSEEYMEKYGTEYIQNCNEESPIASIDFYGENLYKIGNPTHCSKIKRQLGIQKRGCYVCEHFSYCPKFCWTQLLFIQYPIGQCPIKRAYQYLDQHSDIIEEYKKWRTQNDKNGITI